MIFSLANIRKAKNYCKKNGVKSAFYASIERLQQNRKKKYVYEAPSKEEWKRQSEEKLIYTPKISVLVPAYETRPVYMEDLVLSLQEQSYGNFEIIIADASKTKGVERMVRGLMEQYDNICYYKLEENLGISENSNAALEKVTGDYVALLDHDDLLTSDALYEVVKEIIACRDKTGAPVLVYSDEDKTNSYLEYYYEPNRKLPLNAEMILTNNYICHLSVFREDVIRELGFRKEYDGAQDYDLILRTLRYAKEKYGDAYKDRIRHVEKVLYHWRCHEGSTAQNPESKTYAYDAGKRAVEDYVAAMGWNVTVSNLKHLGFYRLDYPDGIFRTRPEIGIVGGPVYAKDKIISGAMDGKGNVLYEGLHREFSGELHRAVLQQEVPAADIRNMMVREDLIDLFEKSTGMKYPVSAEIAQKTLSREEEEKIKRKSINFCNKAKKKNIVIVYEPQLKGNEIEN